VTRLGEIIKDLQNGFACGERDSNGIIQLRMNNVDRLGNMVMDEYIRVPLKYYSDVFDLQSGDILFNHTNSAELVGKTLHYSGYSEPVTFSNHFVRLRVDTNRADTRYISSYFNLLWSNKFFESYCDRWIGQAAFQPKKLTEVKISLPPLDEQRRIAAEIDRQLSTVEKAKQAAAAQMAAINAMPAAILRQAFSGQM